MSDDQAPVSVQDLERERLRTYVEWGEADVPWWWLATYGLAVTLALASWDLGDLWRVLAMIAFAAVMGALVSAITRWTGVSTPRFRGMPHPLARTYLAPVAGLLVGLLFAAAVAAAVGTSATLFGLFVGPGIAIGLAVQGRWYRVEARRLADEAGIER